MYTTYCIHVLLLVYYISLKNYKIFVSPMCATSSAHLTH